ncbi:MAG: MFS transporter [Anaerolineae bacterium]|nr:MFS transporter [Anaerolineae bacterium]
MTEPSERVPRLTKIIYGTGDWGMASFNTLRMIFYAIFLTDVVGLEPRLASFGAFVGVIWDAVNDPLVGVWSDKVRTRWGRRRPFLLVFAIPYALAFLILWWAPPWKSQILLMIHVLLAYAVSDTLQTLVIVPFQALTPEMTSDYDERTSLASYRMFFNFLASLAAGVAAPMIVDAIVARGGTQQQGYMLAAALFGVTSAIPYLAIFFVVREREHVTVAPEMITLRTTLKKAWRNVPFRYATALYMLNWVTFDLISTVLPFFIVYWVAQGDLLFTVPGIGMPLESVALGAMALVAVPILPFWSWLAQKIGKRKAYLIAIAFWIVIMMAVFMLPPLRIGLALALATLMGFSYSAAHLLPDAIFPDVIDWEELQTGERHEGIYFGTKNFIRKLTTAFAIFVTLQVLGWMGYKTPPASATVFMQPEAVLTGIRVLIGPFASLMLLALMVVTWFYPLNRSRYERMQRLLRRRQLRDAAHQANAAAIAPANPLATDR